ncbi:MAG TPA: aminoglycoside phosphotransferase family protein [Ornithinibacter sp.]|nr:aminoglycoside phosphotransferase family protein [Ornithinibacter sp.]
MSRVALPADWVTRVSAYPADGGPTGAEWVATVPRRLDDALDRWGLVADGDPRTGWTAVVVPVVRDGEQLVLKVTWPHPEGEHEALALRTWGGSGAVRLVAALPSDGVLLLERLDADTDLRDVWVDEACEVVGGLLGRLQVAAPPQIARMSEYLTPHLERMAGRAAVPRRIVSRTQGLARELLTGEVPERLLHTDLHFENVLRGPGGWTAIDPKPVAGHPGFDLFPLLHNRVGELGTGAAFRWSVRHRVSLAAEAAGIDLDEAFAWTLLRAGIEVSWVSATGSADELSLHVALTKALDE